MDTLLNKLEYIQILDKLSKHCKTYLGKRNCYRLAPKFTFEEVEALLNQTKEATSLLHQKGTPPFLEIEEMETYLKMLESSQTVSMQALLTIAHLLKMARELVEYFYGDDNFDLSSFSCLDAYFSSLYKNASIEKNILDKIIDENTMADNASNKLSFLRRNRKNIEEQIKDKLNQFLHSSTYAKYIMDPIVTIRSNRYVIPVKEEYRSQIKGFVHDTSSSGSTLYIEPTSVFELNNQINHIKMEEELEIERILQILSSSLSPYIKELEQNLSITGELDLIFAKAHYGIENDGIEPNLTQEKQISFYRAKHPFIEKDKVVPIDISIGKDYTCLLITGPNTGGKTVALKTLGLLLLMAYSGIPVPCHEKSSICVFSHIFADIGDDQSIQESLSTFSAHMKNIVEITKHVDSNSLVLLDELGSGTDPVEGAALAISILSYLKEQESLVCCTTHYQELKEFALVTDGFENASFEFDLENLKPTYHLLIGIPGKSNAFAISQKLGLDTEILEKASSYLKEDKVSIEELLKSIYDQKLEIEKQEEETRKNLAQIEILRKSLENKQEDIAEKRKEYIENAKIEARDILLSAKEEVNEIIRELSHTTDTKKANSLRNELNNKLRDLNHNNFENDLVGNIEDSEKMEKLANIQPQEIRKGLEVYVVPLQAKGTIISEHLNNAQEVKVEVGNMKMNIKLTNLQKISNSFDTNSNSLKQHSSHTSNSSKMSLPINHGIVTTNQSSKSKTISPEINVIGQNVDEAIYVIDKYIDNCVIAHISPIRIVHGKGTGKLREGIHNYLKKNPQVKSFRLGTFGEGEMGVTVVELK